MMQRLDLAVALVVVLTCVPGGADTVDARLAQAERGYDLGGAQRILESLPGGDGSAEAVTLRVRAALLVAELARIEFEMTAETERDTRRALGKRIDGAAREGLEALETIPKGPRHFRMEADLLGTMIRSDFRAKKYLDRMHAATARALELDPDNARACVSAAKPLVFAGPDQGRDLEQALHWLDRALMLEPGLESALLLRARAHELRGDDAAARSDLNAALAANTECRPARQRLAAPGVEGPELEASKDLRVR